MPRLGLAFLTATAVFAPPLPAQHTLDFEGRYWIPAMSGRLGVERNGFGTDIDARNDLGIPDASFPQGSVTLQHGRNRLRFAYTPIEYAGDNTVIRTVTFRGTQYTAGTRVVSELEARHLELSWAYQFIHLADGRFRLGPMIEADGFLLHGQLSAPNLHLTAS